MITLRQSYSTTAIAITFTACGLFPVTGDAERPNRQPNFVIIMADDQGYQDLGCYGSPLIKTPHLDQMAKEGVRFTSFYSANSVCSPSRAALLTGCYPTRVGIPAVLFPRDVVGLNSEELTIAELLKTQGYATACIGKWHLGHHPPFLPTRHGFDSYFGIPYSNDMRIDKSSRIAENVVLRDGYSLERIQQEEPQPNTVPLMRGEEIVEYPADQTTLTKRYTEEAIRFITENRERPFFLYLPHTMPHIPLFASDEFRGTSQRGLYGDTIEELDHSTGRILQTLDELGIGDNTLVVYTSDNGPWKLKNGHGGHADPLRGFKFSTFEGGMRVPCIMRWPDSIPAGTTCDKVAATIDLLPTIADIVQAPLPGDRTIDGKSLVSLLADPENESSPHDAYYYYSGNTLQAVRRGKWKLRRAKDEVQLFDLHSDLGESENLAEANEAIVAELSAMMDDFDESLKSASRPRGRLNGPDKSEGGNDKTQNSSAAARPDPLAGSRSEIYKSTEQAELAIHIFEPSGHKATDQRAAIVFFFGGGWQSGNLAQFAPHCRYLASRGMVAMVADYRVAKRHKTTPFHCVQDAKSAIRWIRANAGRLGLDPNRIAAGGGSAGGHIAAAAEACPALDEPGEDTTVSCRPNALVLFNPVFDNGPDGYGYERVKERYREISPMHNIRTGMVPAIVFLGTADRLIPVSTAQQFQTGMQAVGSRCELELYEGQPHGFFNHPDFRKNASPRFFDETTAAMDRFLVSLGFLESEPEPDPPTFEMVRGDDGTLDVKYNGQNIARYMFAYDTSNDDAAHATYKPFLHVFDDDGKEFITKGPGGLYTHHRGIFIGFSKFEIDGKQFDTWHMKNCVQVQQELQEHPFDDQSCAVFTSLVHWQDSAGDVLLEEERRFFFISPPDGAYASIEMWSDLHAVSGDVRLAGDPEHAGVQFRPANDIVKEETQYHFHDEEIDPKSDRDMPWVGETFQIPSGKYSVVMFNYPDNPKGTIFSAYRDYGRFGAYPAFEIPEGNTRRLKYRWVISAGDMLPEDTIESVHDAFSGDVAPDWRR